MCLGDFASYKEEFYETLARTHRCRSCRSTLRRRRFGRRRTESKQAHSKHPAPFILEDVLGSDCPGFAVTAQLTGKSKFIDLPGDRFIGISPGATVTLTGPSGTVSYVITGSTHIQVLPDGGQEIRSIGRNLIIVPNVLNKHPEGLFLTTGNVNYALNEDGTERRLFAGPGRVTAVCPLLGP